MITLIFDDFNIWWWLWLAAHWWRPDCIVIVCWPTLPSSCDQNADHDLMIWWSWADGLMIWWSWFDDSMIMIWWFEYHAGNNLTIMTIMCGENWIIYHPLFVSCQFLVLSVISIHQSHFIHTEIKEKSWTIAIGDYLAKVLSSKAALWRHTIHLTGTDRKVFLKEGRPGICLCHHKRWTNVKWLWFKHSLGKFCPILPIKLLTMDWIGTTSLFTLFVRVRCPLSQKLDLVGEK